MAWCQAHAGIGEYVVSQHETQDCEEIDEEEWEVTLLSMEVTFCSVNVVYCRDARNGVVELLKTIVLCSQVDSRGQICSGPFGGLSTFAGLGNQFCL